MNTSASHSQPIPQTWGTSGRNVFLYMANPETAELGKVAMTTERAIQCRTKAKKLLAASGQTLSDVRWRASSQVSSVLANGIRSLKDSDLEYGVGFIFLHLDNSAEYRRAIATNRKLGLEVLAGHWVYLTYRAGLSFFACGTWFSNAKIPGGILPHPAADNLVGAIVRHDVNESEALRQQIEAAGEAVAVARRYL